MRNESKQADTAGGGNLRAFFEAIGEWPATAPTPDASSLPSSAAAAAFLSGFEYGGSPAILPSTTPLSCSGGIRSRIFRQAKHALQVKNGSLDVPTFAYSA